jgi:hypothetical protein
MTEDRPPWAIKGMAGGQASWAAASGRAGSGLGPEPR